jgi:hypothetical protein
MQGGSTLYMQLITMQGGRIIIYVGNYYARAPDHYICGVCWSLVEGGGLRWGVVEGN